MKICLQHAEMSPAQVRAYWYEHAPQAKRAPGMYSFGFAKPLPVAPIVNVTITAAQAKRKRRAR